MFLCIGAQSLQAGRLELWHDKEKTLCNGTFSLRRMQTSLLVCWGENASGCEHQWNQNIMKWATTNEIEPKDNSCITIWKSDIFKSYCLALQFFIMPSVEKKYQPLNLRRSLGDVGPVRRYSVPYIHPIHTPYFHHILTIYKTYRKHIQNLFFHLF